MKWLLTLGVAAAVRAKYPHSRGIIELTKTYTFKTKSDCPIQCAITSSDDEIDACIAEAKAHGCTGKLQCAYSVTTPLTGVEDIPYVVDRDWDSVAVSYVLNSSVGSTGYKLDGSTRFGDGSSYDRYGCRNKPSVTVTSSSKDSYLMSPLPIKHIGDQLSLKSPKLGSLASVSAHKQDTPSLHFSPCETDGIAGVAKYAEAQGKLVYTGTKVIM